MEFKTYLAMTAREMEQTPEKPKDIAYIGCFFIPQAPWIGGIPTHLPLDSLLILDDRTAPCPEALDAIPAFLSPILQQLAPAGFVLDFQHPNLSVQQELSESLIKSLPCPVIVSDLYARSLSCPVFVSAPSPHLSLSEYLSPWKGREIWLEEACDEVMLTLTDEGCSLSHPRKLPEGSWFSQDSIRYLSRIFPHKAEFYITRGEEQLEIYRSQAKSLGVQSTIGLFCANPHKSKTDAPCSIQEASI